MKRWMTLGLGALVMTTLLYGQTAPVGSTGVAAAPGRYQLVVAGTNNSEIWMIDTQTGDLWRRASGATRWTYVGNPTLDPGTKLPVPAAPTTRSTGRGRGLIENP